MKKTTAAETMAVAVAEADGEIRSPGLVPNQESAVRQLVRCVRTGTSVNEAGRTAEVRPSFRFEPMPRESRLLTWTGLVVLALALGLGSAALSLRIVSRRAAIRIGPWGTSTTVGSSEAGMYERASVAAHALFVLNRGETVYFRAHVDDSGRDLDARCEYEIRGWPLDARWWSITAYGSDDFLIPNAQDRYSFNMANLAREPDGSFLIRASSRSQPGNWLPLGEKGHRSFTLRLYAPSAEIAAHPERATLPSIAGECR